MQVRVEATSLVLYHLVVCMRGLASRYCKSLSMALRGGSCIGRLWHARRAPTWCDPDLACVIRIGGTPLVRRCR